MTQIMKPGAWGTKHGKPAISWWRHGRAAAGEPRVVTEVRTYETEMARFDAAFSAGSSAKSPMPMSES
jgi:hypothetical protein